MKQHYCVILLGSACFWWFGFIWTSYWVCSEEMKVTHLQFRCWNYNHSFRSVISSFNWDLYVLLKLWYECFVLVSSVGLSNVLCCDIVFLFVSEFSYYIVYINVGCIEFAEFFLTLFCWFWVWTILV